MQAGDFHFNYLATVRVDSATESYNKYKNISATLAF